MSADFVPQSIPRLGSRPRRQSAQSRTAEQRAADYFKGSTVDHEMTILHDDGVYRHIRFAKPGTGIWSWTLTTWPGHLCIDGDLESLTFSREHDMFEFFQLHGARINPLYWAEKITNYDAQRGTRKFCSEKAKAVVLREFMAQRHYRGRDIDTVDVFRDLREEVIDQLHHFSEEEFYDAVNHWQYLGGWEFEDVYEWDVKDWSVHYLYACHAIAWGIVKYREAAQLEATR